MRSQGRRRPIVRINDREAGKFVFMGPLTHDAVDGTRLPIRDTVHQRSGRVSNRWSDGTRDRPSWW